MKLRVIMIQPANCLRWMGIRLRLDAGRQSVCDTRGQVSRHHCRFSRIDGDWLVEDLHSVNGVLVNGQGRWG